MRRIWANKISALAMIACGTALSLTLSCSTAQPQFETPYKANVISFVPKTSATDESWTIETKDLATLEHPAKAQGKYFEIITGSSIKIDSTSGSLTVATNTNQDRTDLRLDSRNGVIVARDTASLYALSAFYSFELLFQQLEQVIPIDADKLFEENGGRLKVFLQPSLVERSNWSNAVVTPKMNAAFNPENNDFYLLKSSVLEKIPLAANYKVIAHEFGHLLFKKSFDTGRMEKCQGKENDDFLKRKADKHFSGRWSLEYAISGINEGFADFISYILTRSENPLADAFVDDFAETQKENRSLTGSPFTFDQLSNNNTCQGLFYCIGTLFARSLYRVAKDYEAQPQLMTQFSHRVYTALSQVRELLKQPPLSEILPTPSDAIAECMRKSEIDFSYDGDVNSAFLAAFISAFPDVNEKRTLCASFEELFGEVGFKKEARSVCTF